MNFEGSGLRRRREIVDKHYNFSSIEEIKPHVLMLAKLYDKFCKLLEQDIPIRHMETEDNVNNLYRPHPDLTLRFLPEIREIIRSIYDEQLPAKPDTGKPYQILNDYTMELISDLLIIEPNNKLLKRLFDAWIIDCLSSWGQRQANLKLIQLEEFKLGFNLWVNDNLEVYVCISLLLIFTMTIFNGFLAFPNNLSIETILTILFLEPFIIAAIYAGSLSEKHAKDSRERIIKLLVQ